MIKPGTFGFDLKVCKEISFWLPCIASRASLHTLAATLCCFFNQKITNHTKNYQ